MNKIKVIVKFYKRKKMSQFIAFGWFLVYGFYVNLSKARAKLINYIMKKLSLKETIPCIICISIYMQQHGVLNDIMSFLILN